MEREGVIDNMHVCLEDYCRKSNFITRVMKTKCTFR